jgi:uncharacterized metal-binding protein
MKRKPSSRPRLPDCAACGHEPGERLCVTQDGKAAKGCPTVGFEDLLAEANGEYAKPEVREFARQASIQEGAGYANRHQRPYIPQPSKTRIVEICEFARRMGYRRLGLAFCTGLSREAALVEEIFRARGFEVVSVVCKAGRTPKGSVLGLADREKIRRGTEESMCNSIFQARLLNAAGVEFNVLLGLCVGHDSLFFRYARAPVTVLAVKDRVTGHNPLAAVYLSHSYYRKVRHPELE